MDVVIDTVNVIQVQCESIPLSASFRTRVFEYITEYNENDIFLYLDTDIIVTNPLPTFDAIDSKI